MKLGDRIVDGVAILEQMRIEVKPIHYRFTFGGETEVWEDHILLPESCSIFNHYCQLDTATYIWGELKPTLYQWIKSFQGHIIYQEGQEVLISQTDKIRLVLGEEEKNMGRVYRQKNTLIY